MEEEDYSALPPPDKLRDIAARQDAAAQRTQDRRQKGGESQQGEEEEEKEEQGAAARLIQRNYRGYRTRREMRGQGLSPGVRWEEAVKAARYRNTTSPRPRRRSSGSAEASSGSEERERRRRKRRARSAWQRAGAVARKAASDETSSEEAVGEMTDERRARRERKRKLKEERQGCAKMMGLEYFLEMVDQKHRYGSSLRAYHRVWQESGTKENFFYWLDHGEGMAVDLEDRPRERLEREQIRYLSREERKKYLVEIGADGLFRWARNGELITTSPDWRDSVDGIVPAASKTPTWRETQQGTQGESSSDDEDEDGSSVSGLSTGSQEDDQRYVNQELQEANGISKLKHVNASALMNSLLRKTTKKNTWIFVADTSFRIYFGIKQSGAFQHSSFLHGARVSAAGLIRMKRGQLRRLDPLSGHYSPPAENFRAFVHSLRETNADMSRVSISRSYAILMGLESYIGAKKRLKLGEQKIVDLLKPEQKRRREEAQMDTSKSAEMERKAIEEEREKEKGHTEGLHAMAQRKLNLAGAVTAV